MPGGGPGRGRGGGGAPGHEQCAQPGAHGSTFGGNPLACRAALAVLATVEAEGLVGHAAEVGELLHSTLEDLGQKLVRGVGLMQALVFEEPKAKAFQNACLENGLIVNAVDDNTIRCVPPLILSAAQVEQAGELMRKSLD